MKMEINCPKYLLLKLGHEILGNSVRLWQPGMWMGWNLGLDWKIQYRMCKKYISNISVCFSIWQVPLSWQWEHNRWGGCVCVQVKTGPGQHQTQLQLWTPLVFLYPTLDGNSRGSFGDKPKFLLQLKISIQFLYIFLKIKTDSPLKLSLWVIKQVVWEYSKLLNTSRS